MDLGKNSISKITNAIDIFRAFIVNVGLTLFNNSSVPILSEILPDMPSIKS